MWDHNLTSETRVSKSPKHPLTNMYVGARCFSTRHRRVTGYILTALPTGAASGPPSASAGCMGMQVRSPGTAQGLARDTHTHTVGGAERAQIACVPTW